MMVTNNTYEMSMVMGSRSSPFFKESLRVKISSTPTTGLTIMLKAIATVIKPHLYKVINLKANQHKLVQMLMVSTSSLANTENL